MCGRYRLGAMVCLFHVHEENLRNYVNNDASSMPLSCQRCLWVCLFRFLYFFDRLSTYWRATMKIHSKKYFAPCRLTSVRCDCGLPAAFHQSKKDNSNRGCYFFGCRNWNKTKRCDFFKWSNEHQDICDLQILRQLHRPAIGQAQPSSPSSKVPNTLEELQRIVECVICQSEARSHSIRPCNHMCLCQNCAGEIGNQCPICRQAIESIERVFMVWTWRSEQRCSAFLFVYWKWRQQLLICSCTRTEDLRVHMRMGENTRRRAKGSLICKKCNWLKRKRREK